jgi:hypothetical protein
MALISRNPATGEELARSGYQYTLTRQPNGTTDVDVVMFARART